MSKVNGQGLARYLNRAAEIRAENGPPNVSTLVVTKDSLDRDAPMPSEGSFADRFYARTGLPRDDVVAEQAKVRTFDWKSVKTLGL